MSVDMEIDDLLGMMEGESPGPVVKGPEPLPALVSDGMDPSEFMEAAGLRSGKAAPDITRPWMKYHTFTLVRTADELDQIVDAAIAAGACALDLETEGLDNRIFYDEQGKPFTKHKIVGFCLSYDGVTGYYAPVRHRPDGENSPLNLPIDRAEASIRRLCLASQPEAKTPEVLLKDPLSFKEWASIPKLVLYFWNAKFDQEFLYPITGIDWWHPESFEDGNLGYYVFYSDDKQLSLKWKAYNELRDPDGNPYEMIEIKDLFNKGRPIEFATLSPDEGVCTKYACSDAICTYLLCHKPRATDKHRYVMGAVKEKYSFTYRLEKQTAQAMRWMERPRVRVNKDRVKALVDENSAKRDEVLTKIVQLAASKGFHNFDPKSTKTLGEFLFASGSGLDITVPASADWPGGKPPRNEKSGQYKTDADTLERLVSEFPEVPDVLKWIVEWRGYEKLDSTYLQHMYHNVDAHSEMRFQFKQTGAATGRFSAPAGEPEQGFSGIPVHGIPATSALRTCFEARDGYTMVKADYAGEELRIAANVSGEPVWIKEFLEGEGDLHSITARAFFNKAEVSKEERKMGKIANFALLYGGGPASIIRATGCDKLEATRRKQAFDKAVPTFAGWIKSQHQKVKKEKGVWTALGRWIAIPDIDSPEKAIVAACERKSINFPIQGTGADIMKIALVLLCKEFYKKGWLKQGGGDDSVRMLLTVHDEIVFEIKHARVQEALELIVRVMASPTYMACPPHSPKWRVALVVEPLIGLNWAGEYDYGMLTHGKKYKDGDKIKGAEFRLGDHVYHKLPPWLEGLFKPGWESGDTPHVTTPSESVTTPAPATPQAPVPPTSKPVPHVTQAKTDDITSSSVVVVKIGLLTRNSVSQVREACAAALDPDEGKILCLTDHLGQVLIDPSLQIKVIPEKLVSRLRDRNLSDGSVHPYKPS